MRVDALTAKVLGPRAALVSGTVPSTLAARSGWPDVAALDVGHPFDYAGSVVGWMSTMSGQKTPPGRLRGAQRSAWTARRDVEYGLRAAELDWFIGDGQALVLCPSHPDIAVLERYLVPRLRARGLTVYQQPRDGRSQSALEQAAAFRAHFERHRSGAVLIGTDSLTTGVDIPGAALSRVAWWCLPLGMTTPADDQVERFYPGYVTDRCRVKVAQGIGRLLRTVGDRGEVLLCDQRFHDHVKGATSIVDRHLRQIPWRWLRTRTASAGGVPAPTPSPEQTRAALDAAGAAR